MSALEALRASQDRDLRRVGIPMFLVLRDELSSTGERDAGDVGDADAALTDAAATDKALMDKALTDKALTDKALTDRALADRALADRLDVLRAELAPSQRDTDLGLVSTLLTVGAHLDFGRRTQEETR